MDQVGISGVELRQCWLIWKRAFARGTPRVDGDEPTRNSDSMVFSLRLLRSRQERAAAYATVQPER
jgi:hypothetical protein